MLFLYCHAIVAPPIHPAGAPWPPPAICAAGRSALSPTAGDVMRDVLTTTDIASTPAGTRRGEMEAFTALVERYERPIFAFVYRRMDGNAADAADLTQEAFIKAYRALPRTPADLNVGAWLHRIAANCCVDELRRRRRARCQPWDEALHGADLRGGDAADPERIALDREADAVVRAILGRMSPRNERALVLRECVGLSCAEVGAAMGVSRQAAKSMLFRAREEFRRLAEAGTGDPTEKRGPPNSGECRAGTGN